MQSRRFFSVGFSIISSLVFLSVPLLGVRSEVYSQEKHAATIYTCAMHPEVVSDKSGKCLKCGMNLVKKEDERRNSSGGGQIHTANFVIDVKP